eukprot:6976839-Lingulodinium_polyedra.AAC.1
MGSDGLTKGAVGRELLHLIMSGRMPLKHAFEQWHCKAPRALPDTSADTLLTLFTLVAPRAGSQLCAGPSPAPCDCLTHTVSAAITMASSSEQEEAPLTLTPA